jgi:hypothetical protein
MKAMGYIRGFGMGGLGWVGLHCIPHCNCTNERISGRHEFICAITGCRRRRVAAAGNTAGEHEQGEAEAEAEAHVAWPGQCDLGP